MYKSKNHSKYSLKAHLVFATKYRKKLFTNSTLAFELKCKIIEIAKRSNFKVELVEVDEDHIHILVDYEPNISIVQIVRRLKQETQYYMWILFEKELKTCTGKIHICSGLKDILYVVLEKELAMKQYKNIFRIKDDHSYA